MGPMLVSVLEVAAGAVIGGLISLWISQKYAKESAAQVQRVSDAIAHNLRAIVTFIAAPNNEAYELQWERGTDRIM
jgi:hypothetical protein